MRDKLIDIILTILVPEPLYNYSRRVAADYHSILEAELQSRRTLAGKIADALLDECYIFHSDFCIEVELDDPVGEMGEPGVWVSVEDALPEEGERVLACDVRGGLDYEVWTLRKDTEPYWMDSEYGWHELGSCSHWMPLPAPPKEE